jgi:hypothetical protein
MSSAEMPESLELQMQEVERSTQPVVERSTPHAADGDENVVAYDKNRGEDQWPEFAEEQSFSTRAIQYISNHTGAHERTCRAAARPSGLARCLARAAAPWAPHKRCALANPGRCWRRCSAGGHRHRRHPDQHDHLGRTGARDPVPRL